MTQTMDLPSRRAVTGRTAGYHGRHDDRPPQRGCRESDHVARRDGVIGLALGLIRAEPPVAHKVAVGPRVGEQGAVEPVRHGCGQRDKRTF